MGFHSEFLSFWNLSHLLDVNGYNSGIPKCRNCCRDFSTNLREDMVMSFCSTVNAQVSGQIDNANA